MRNAEKPNLSSVLDYQRDIEPYKFIKIFSGVGSGKTQFACSMILGNREKGIPKQTVLLITSRRSTVEETLKKMGDNALRQAKALGNLPSEFDGEYLPEYDDYARIIRDDDEFLPSDVTVRNKSVVCTNAHIEQYFKKQYIPGQSTTHLWELFDTIIVDEVHSLITDATYQSAPFYVLELINEFLRRCTEHQIQHEEKKHLILMTGTPEPLDVLEIAEFAPERSASYTLFRECVNVLPQNVTVIDRNTAFSKLHKLLKDGEKAIWFSNHVVTKQSVRENWHLDKSIRVEVSFSSDEVKRAIGEKEAQDMKDLEAYIAENRRLPEDVSLFVSTSRNKEGINIENEDIRYLFVESHFSDDVIQMAGRIRAGVENLYIISDTEQLCKGPDFLAADFTSKGIAPLRTAFRDDNKGYANEYLLTVCGDTIPFHRNAEKLAYKTCGSYIDYIHKTFPYARYSYILNQFVFYQQKALAETYTLEKSNAFSHALVKGNQALKQLISNWFPGVTVHSMMTVEVRCKEYIESAVFSQAKYGRAKLTPNQVEELKTGLGEILGRPVAYLNKVLGKLGYELSKRDAKGYYWLTKAGKKPGRTSPGKRRK